MVWTEGIPFYDYYPSKSFGIFYLVAALYQLGVSFSHETLAGVITAIYVLMLYSTHWVVLKLSDWVSAFGQHHPGCTLRLFHGTEFF